jgi:dimethylhistidine N-methyltransferase
MRVSPVPAPSRSYGAGEREAAPVRVVDLLHADDARERRRLVDGLRAPQAAISPKYFYDELGCALFTAICELPEYYPTRTERAIFERHGAEIAAAAGQGAQLVDLGAGDCAKAESLLPVLVPARYVAVDIAADALRSALARIAGRHPALDVLGIACDFTRGLDLGRHLWTRRTTFFYPGSSIGNFLPADAAAFLAAIRAHCARHPGSGLLIGVDTPKEPARLVAAYDDALGVTAAFNRNVLVHVNRVLGSDFDPAAFAHVACYDAAAQRIEMHLEARRAMDVDLDGAGRHFCAGERIHTENSYKYTPEQFAAMLRAAGFGSVRVWQDVDGDFAVCHAS